MAFYTYIFSIFTSHVPVLFSFHPVLPLSLPLSLLPSHDPLYFVQVTTGSWGSLPVVKLLKKIFNI